VMSHFAWFVFGVQLVSGLLLLVNRFVPLALMMLAGVIANILAFHIAMWPASLIPMPIIVTILWFVVAWHYRERLNPLLQPT
jgi:putative oxidoreductase